MNRIDAIGLDRLGMIVLAGGESDPGSIAAALAELSHVGVRIGNKERLDGADVGGVSSIARYVEKRRGKRGTFAPLFSGFPEALPNFDVAELRFLVGAVRLIDTGWRKGDEISDEALRAAMDFSDIGWWPASSVPQDIEATELARAAQDILPTDSRREWITLRIVSRDELEKALKEWMHDCFASDAALRDDVRADLSVLVGLFGVEGIDAGSVRFRENRAELFKLAWEKNPASLVELDATPDDILRMFALLGGADVSLARPVRFPRLNRAQRRGVVNALEASPRLGDIFRRRGLWLALDRGLHIGEFKALRAREAFGRLRDTRHDASSSASRVERLLGSGEYEKACTLLAAETPGVLLRQLRRLAWLAKSGEDQGVLLHVLSETARNQSTKLLLSARANISDNGATYPRMAFSLTGKVSRIDRARGHLAVSEDFVRGIEAVLDDALVAKAKSSSLDWSGKTVWIDEGVKGLLVPTGLRSTAAGISQVERGSRLPLGKAKVLRLFVHWKEAEGRTDLDLSCLALNEAFEMESQVSWTNLADGAMVHSGDLTSAPRGAQEFIDIDLAKARANGWRYLAPSVFRYSGESFAELAEISVGWMLRNNSSSELATFDPGSVVNAFELVGGGRSSLSILVDLEKNEVIYVDVYLSGSPGARVERDGTRMSELLSGAAAARNIKAGVPALIDYHVQAAGTRVVTRRQDADVCIGLDDECDYNVLRPEKFLADLC